MGNGRAWRLTTIVSVLMRTGHAGSSSSFRGSRAEGDPAGPIPGGSLNVEGEGFPAEVAVDIYLDLEHVAIALPDGKDGSFADITVSVPDSALPGRHFVTAISRRDDVTAQVSFIVRSDWPQFHRTADHRANNSQENVLNSSNVANLEILWRGMTNDDVVSSPAIVDGVVYVGSVDGKLYAFREAGCGDHECEPFWQGLTDGQILASPAVSRRNGLRHGPAEALRVQRRRVRRSGVLSDLDC